MYPYLYFPSSNLYLADLPKSKVTKLSIFSSSDGMDPLKLLLPTSSIIAESISSQFNRSIFRLVNKSFQITKTLNNNTSYQYSNF